MKLFPYHQKLTQLFCVSEVMDDLYNWVNPKTGKHSPMISPDIYKIIKDNADVGILQLWLKYTLHWIL